MAQGDAGARDSCVRRREPRPASEALGKISNLYVLQVIFTLCVRSELQGGSDDQEEDGPDSRPQLVRGPAGCRRAAPGPRRTTPGSYRPTSRPPSGPALGPASRAWTTARPR